MKSYDHLVSGIPVSIQWEDYSSSYQPSSSLGNTSSNMSGAMPLNISTGAGEINLPTPPSRRRLAKSFSVTSSKGK